MNEQVNLFDVDGLSADSFKTNAFARPFWFVHRREGLFISLQCVADGHDTFGPFADPDTAAQFAHKRGILLIDHHDVEQYPIMAEIVMTKKLRFVAILLALVAFGALFAPVLVRSF
jgi:hypothetical protein